MQTLVSDLRYALRVLFRSPSFSIGVIGVLALGIGANAATFSIVNAVLLRPLPFDEPARLVRLFHVPPQNAFPGMPTFSVSPANFHDWKRAAQHFENMADYRFRRFTLTGAGTPRAVVAGAVGRDFFQIVRTQPALGRVFLPEEDTPARSRVVILSDGFWKSQFAGNQNVIGGTLRLDGEAYTIVGVMPHGFSVRAWAITARDIWVPLAHDDAARAVRENHNEQVVARLKPGVNLAQARSEMTVISERLEREYPRENTGWGATVIPLQELLVGDVRRALVMLLGAVALVLLIACANVGNLLFARALGRRKEIAIRSALGAGRRRVFQQLLTEAFVLAALGGALGLLLADVGLTAGAALLADQIPRADEISIDRRVLVFVICASIATGLLAGTLPAIRAGSTDLNDSLKEGGRGEDAVGIRTRRLLIVCEVALSLVLLMGAGVMIRSLYALSSVNAGFDPDNVLTMNVSLPEARYPTPAQRSVFYDTLLDRLRALPGVESAAAIDDLPFVGGSVQPIVLEGEAEKLPRDQPTVQVRAIMPGYFKTMRIPVLAGRDVASADVDVMIVSRDAAQLLWGSNDPIGRRATLPLMSRTLHRQVIGIVADVKQRALNEPTAPTVYYYTRDRDWRSLTLTLRTNVPPLSIAPAATAAVRAIDPEQPIEDIRTMVQVRDELLMSQKFSALLLGVFASVALVLASVGIYSVLSYIVRGRSREIGIRTALGAQTIDVVRLVVVEGMTPTLIGIGVGIVAVLGTAKLLETLVFGVSASDPLTLATVAGVLAIVAFVASLALAYRASRVDPIQVLKV